MTNEAEDSQGLPSRRKALQTFGRAGLVTLVVPGEWKRPIIQSIIVPAHAAASAPKPPGTTKAKATTTTSHTTSTAGTSTTSIATSSTSSLPGTSPAATSIVPSTTVGAGVSTSAAATTVLGTSFAFPSSSAPPRKGCGSRTAPYHRRTLTTTGYFDHKRSTDCLACRGPVKDRSFTAVT